ncbi:MAG: response regulator transcription factor [Pseudohongiella sp.]|nr:response regulator transcription factor [Pseudohongiella sp.]
MSAMARILIVDDEPQIVKFLGISLGSQGYDVVSAANGHDAIAQAGLSQPDLIILDLGLPDMDGQHVLRKIREFSGVPLIVLSVRSKESDKVAALDSGANDYVVKPFGVMELLARIRRLLQSSAIGAARTFNARGLVIDYVNRQITLNGAEIKLSKKEYALLRLLTEHAGQLLTQSWLGQQIWGVAYDEQSHYLRILVARLRARLGDDASNPAFIETEPGVGYRFLDT